MRMLMYLMLFVSMLMCTSIAINLKHTDYCTANRQLCKREPFYAFADICPITCEGRLGYKCQYSYCTTDKQACDKLMPNSDLIKTMRMTNEYQKQMRKLNVFISSLSQCPWLRYRFSQKDVCFKGIACFLFRSLMRNSKWPACTCKSSHSFKCGENHCTTNVMACDVLKTDYKKRLISRNC